MGTRPSRPQLRQTNDFEETPLAARKRQARSWLILGAGAIGIAGAIAKWAMQARQGTPTASGKPLLRANQTADLTLQSEGTGTPVPLTTAASVAPVAGMPQSAAPTNDSRTALVEPEAAPEPIVNQGATPLPTPAPATFASTPKKTKTGKTAKSTAATPDMITPTAIAATAAATATTPSAPNSAPSGGSRKRGKMSEEYDQALQANSQPTQEGAAKGSVGAKGNSMTNSNSTGASSTPVTGAQAGNAPAASAGPAPSTALGGAAEQALSTQAEGKMAVGEELRDREFPVPPQESGAASQKLVVDQETMHDGGPRQGGAVGTIPGDHQNKGEVGDIEDQAAKTPDFAQQR